MERKVTAEILDQGHIYIVVHTVQATMSCYKGYAFYCIKCIAPACSVHILDQWNCNKTTDVTESNGHCRRCTEHGAPEASALYLLLGGFENAFPQGLLSHGPTDAVDRVCLTVLDTHTQVLQLGGVRLAHGLVLLTCEVAWGLGEGTEETGNGVEGVIIAGIAMVKWHVDMRLWIIVLHVRFVCVNLGECLLKTLNIRVASKHKTVFSCNTYSLSLQRLHSVMCVLWQQHS